MTGHHANCSGCSLCLLACPVWRQTRDIRLTPHGRAKALQNGAVAAEIAASVAACTLCGACEPACPERLPLVDMIVELRRASPASAATAFFEGEEPEAETLLLPGRALRADAARLARIAGLLDAAIAADDGSDLAEALEKGIAIPDERRDAFIRNVRRARRLIVADGLVLRTIREWLPKARARSLGEALSAHEAVRAQLRASDLYVIGAPAFHAEHARLVGHYDELRKAIGLQTNLDLQRLAVPTCSDTASPAVSAAEQARWIAEGRIFDRVVVEDVADCAAFEATTGRPVVHLGDL